jgi:hypothetical protein
VDYRGAGRAPDLRVGIDGNDMEVRLVPAGGDPADAPVLARVHDNIQLQGIDQFRHVSAELYHFVDHFYVLRLWFAWLWKAGAVTAGHEIPDAERFDLVIDPLAAKVEYAATDAHWKEHWCPGPPFGDPIEMEIGLFSPQVVAGLPKLIRAQFAALLRSDETASAQHEAGAVAPGVHIPAEIVRQAVVHGVPAEHVGAGVEAHVPRLINCPPPEGPAFISSDPRAG